MLYFIWQELDVDTAFIFLDVIGLVVANFIDVKLKVVASSHCN